MYMMELSGVHMGKRVEIKYAANYARLRGYRKDLVGVEQTFNDVVRDVWHIYPLSDVKLDMAGYRYPANAIVTILED